MRYRHLLFGVALLVPVIAASQATPESQESGALRCRGLTADREQHPREGDLQSASLSQAR